MKQFVIYCFGCKENWGYGGRGLNKFHASERGAYLRGGGGGGLNRGFTVFGLQIQNSVVQGLHGLGHHVVFLRQETLLHIVSLHPGV